MRTVSRRQRDIFLVEGRVKMGTDPHFEEGRYNIYPTAGSLLRYHIPPFRAAIEADTTSIMPYYAYPSNASAPQGLPPFNAGSSLKKWALP